MEIIYCEQGTPEWFEARRGLPTASRFKDILAKGEGKMRRTYMRELAAEIVTGVPGESFSTLAMERGKVMEAEARELYRLVTSFDLQRVGFIRNGRKGWSPDALLDGINTGLGALEIKTQRADLLVETLLRDEVPPEHMAQCQGGIWIGERDFIELVIYWPGMPMFLKRVNRNDKYIDLLAVEVDRFNEELEDMVAKVQRYGGFNDPVDLPR